MQDKLCYPCSSRNPLRVISSLQLTRSHVSVICERSLNFWVIAFAWSQTKTSIHLLCFVSELSSSTKQIWQHTNFWVPEIEISLVSQFLSCLTSTWETYVIESINTLTNISSSSWFRFLFLEDNGYALGAIIISTSPSTSLKPDESRGLSFHIWILPSSPPMQLNQYEKKVMGKLTSSSSNIERMIPVWQFFQSEWRTQVRDWVWTEGERMSDDSNWSSLEESETMVNWSQTRQQTSFDQRLNVSISLTAHMTMHWHLSSTNLPKIC